MNRTMLSNTLVKELTETASAMVAKGKGILAADESDPTIKKRFDSIGVDSTPDNRRDYRELLFTTPDLEKYISGVILFDETLRQSGKNKVPLAEVLSQKGIIPGIKVDKGLTNIPGTREEKATQGLDNLGERLEEYKSLGARFAKWRAVIKIGNHQPSRLCLDINAHALARYAAVCQQAGLVPIVEPEILINGPHNIATSRTITEWTLSKVFSELSRHRVLIEGMILKPSMVTSGDEHSDQADIATVAETTVKAFKRTVPAALPGIAFLSGGQSSELATQHLNAMNKIDGLPWELSFSFGRALQEKALQAWKGKTENAKDAQDVLFHRAQCNGAARFGEYTRQMENQLK